MAKEIEQLRSEIGALRQLAGLPTPGQPLQWGPTMADDREQALRDRVIELERRNEALERAEAAEEAKLTPRQRAIVDARLAERDPAAPLN
jgi:hypothetical protein